MHTVLGQGMLVAVHGEEHLPPVALEQVQERDAECGGLGFKGEGQNTDRKQKAWVSAMRRLALEASTPAHAGRYGSEL